MTKIKLQIGDEMKDFFLSKSHLYNWLRIWEI